VGEGFLSYDDLSVIEPDALMEMGGLSQEVVDRIVSQAEAKAAEAEAAAAEQRRKQREADRLAAAENVDEGQPAYLAEESVEAGSSKAVEPSAGEEKNV
jgi:N utilization substance protein A